MKLPTVKFVYDRKHQSAPKRKGHVDLRVTYQGRQKFLSTGISVLPRHWDARTEQVKDCYEASDYNVIIASMKKKVLQIISRMVDNGKIDLPAIAVQMRQETVTMTFPEYVRMRMEKRQVTAHTHKSYVTMYNKMCEFGRFRTFADITQKNIRDFSEWLHAYKRKENDADGNEVEKKYRQATIYKITSNLSLFISDAVVDGYLTENPYITKRMSENKGGTRIDQYLTPEEVEKIEKAKMPTPAVAKSRDMFLLQCQTGLAYIDLITYPFKADEDRLCRGTRHKTGTEFVFILTDKARGILRRMGYKVPKLSNQKYNAHLKIVGDAAGIRLPLTSHVGRRTAGSIWLNSGIPVEVVARCLGHQSIQVTQRAYARILDKTVEEAFAKVSGDKKKAHPVSDAPRSSSPGD